MSLLVIITGVALLSIPAVASTARLTPALKVRASCAAITFGFIVVGVGLAITASPLIIVWHDGEPIDGVAHLSPGGTWAWAASAALGFLGAIVATGAVRSTLRRRRRIYLASSLVPAVLHNRHGVTIRILPMERALALATPSPRPEIVVSQALHGHLTTEQFDAVVAHEAAHLQLRHDRKLLTLSLYNRVWGWLPGVEMVVADLRMEVEKWADQHAVDTGATTHRSLASAIGAVVSQTRSPFDTGDLEQRVAALLTDSSSDPLGRQHIAMTALCIAALACSAYAITHSLIDLSLIVAAAH